MSIEALLGTILLASLVGPAGLCACGSNHGATSGGAGGADPDGGACATDASPGCNCPNAGMPYSYTVALSGDPSACGLSTTASDNAQALCSRLCGGCFSTIGSSCHLTTQGAVQCDVMCPPAGRRPAGLGPLSGAPGPGGYFAHAAYLEAASVEAFRIVRDELAVHGAPKRLIRAAERAARDETRHARATSALARRHGAKPERPRALRREPRPIEALAVDNAVEGCVRETFGALVAMWQARRASDPDVRAIMARIAPDEARHAALSFEIAAWAEPRLDAAGRARVAEATRRAVDELRARPARERDAELSRIAGLPSVADMQRLIAELDRALWSTLTARAFS
jgi:hypothetical protein